MYLESITACGFLSIQNAKKKNFKLQKTSSYKVKDLDNNMTELDDYTFIKAFSIIFDKKYAADFELNELINKAFRGKSFVEVVLWQNKTNTLNGSKLLNNDRLKVVRYLEEPNMIRINDKGLEIDIFHEETSKHGFISLDGFHMHRLLDDEIVKLSHFTGDDLWSLILKVNESEGLVRTIEERQLKRNLNSEQMEMYMHEMGDVLPLKLKLRDDIRTHFQLSRHFKTLLSLVSKKKLKILENERKKINMEMMKIRDEFITKHESLTQQKAQRVNVALNRRLQIKLEDLLNNQIDFLQNEMSEICYDKESSCVMIASSFQTLNKKLMSAQQIALETISKHEQSIEDFTEFCSSKFFKLQAQLSEIKWKVSLTESVEKKSVYDMKLSLLSLENQMTKSHLEKLSKELVSINNEIEEFKKEISQAINNVEINDTSRDYQQQMETRQKVLQLNSEIFNCQKQVIELDDDIISVTILGQMESKPIQTLKAIEEFIMKDKELAVDYLGPIFQYLNTDNETDVKLWPRLKDFAFIILFTRGLSSRKANRLLVNSGIKFESYIFLGIDEYAPTKYHQLPPHVMDKITSADILVNDKCRFKNVLKLILHDILLMKKGDLTNDELENVSNLIGHSKTETILRLNRFLMITNENSQLARTTSHLDVLHNVYELIKTRTLITKKIDKAINLKSDLSMILQPNEHNHQTVVNKSIYGFHMLKNLYEAKVDLVKRILSKTSIHVMLKSLIEEIKEKKQWNVELLKNSNQRLQQLLIEQRKTSKLLDPSFTFRELENSIERIEAHNELMVQCLACLPNSGQQDIKKIESDSAYLVMLQQHLDNYLKELNSIHTMILKKIKPFDRCTKQEVELVEIRTRLYEKASEDFVVHDAIKECGHFIERCTKESSIDQDLYNQFRHESLEILAEAFQDCQKKLQLLKKTSIVSHITKEQYGHLVDSIKKVREYAESPTPVIKRNPIAAKTYPIINKIIVKTLKDAVNNYQKTFGVVMAKFIKDSALIFYTRELFNEIKGDDFSWDCFDLGRLKGMDFVVNWKRTAVSKSNVRSETLQKIKGLLLIMHIISYLSIFKFIIIDVKIFDDMNEELEQNIRKFLITVSPFVQIILLNDPALDEVELMDVS